ncbi:MAG: glycosyltransferase, partial [Chloroflexi bacterium]|nr:glycosyltransferase [Chloroflexota bacterium]
MKITHISTSDIKGGAARAAHRLHLGLRAEGHTSRMLVGYKDSSDPEIASVLTSAPLARTVIHRVVYGLGERLSLQNVAPWPRTYLHHPFVRDADVVNLHHIHGNAFPYTILPALTKNRPTVWTLHDMWAITGHCSYPY